MFIFHRSRRPSAYRVYLGIHTEQAFESSKQVRDVEQLILEPQGRDIALLKLDKYGIGHISIFSLQY